MPLPDVSDHLVPVHRLSQFVAGSIVLWGAIPARTRPPEGGLRSWPNERPGDSSSAGGRPGMVPQGWGGGGNYEINQFVFSH